MSYNKKEIKTRSTAKTWLDPYKDDVIVTPNGQWEFPGQVTKIPSNNITMQGVPYPVLGVDDTGATQLMMPGEDYVFPGSSVTEYPMMQLGGTRETTMGREQIMNILEAGRIKGYPVTDKQKEYFLKTAGLTIDKYGNFIDANTGELVRGELPKPEEKEYEPWDYGEEFSSYKKGGSKRRRRRGLRGVTDKNIFTAVNYLQRRSELLYGPRGKHLYLPRAQEGKTLPTCNPCEIKDQSLGWLGDVPRSTFKDMGQGAWMQTMPGGGKRVVSSSVKHSIEQGEAQHALDAGLPYGPTDYFDNDGKHPLLDAAMDFEKYLKKYGYDKFYHPNRTRKGQFDGYLPWDVQKKDKVAALPSYHAYYQTDSDDDNEQKRVIQTHTGENYDIPITKSKYTGDTEAYYKRVLDLYKKRHPENYEKLKQTWKNDPEMYHPDLYEQYFGKNTQSDLVNKQKGGEWLNQYQDGGGTFEEWYSGLPKEKSDTTTYNLRRAFELAPKEDLDNFANDKNAHLYSVYYNDNTGEYEFMKRKDHPTLQKELDWYNSNEGAEFKSKYDLDKSGEYYKYIPKKQSGGWINNY